uniref:EGF-like domain-containing protein n=1 Tax=Maylandia zebra TaxID=106582 RepID=A0A3P9DNT5_9CICH
MCTSITRCAVGWRGYRCDITAPIESHTSRSESASKIIVDLFLCSAKGFQHHRMTNGAMNVEIGNPAYKIYEGDPDDDAGELLESDFALDPDKPTNFTNPVYATLYMGAHNSRNSLASTDEKKELLSQVDEDMSDPLA